METTKKNTAAATTGQYRIVPNLASEQAETVDAFSADDAVTDFLTRRPGVEIWDVILLKSARFPVRRGDGQTVFITIPDNDFRTGEI